MRISRLTHVCTGLALVVGLAACEGPPAGMGFLEGAVPGNDGPPAIRDTVLAETVKITAPSGYCVDTRSRRNGLSGAFVVRNLLATHTDGSVEILQTESSQGAFFVRVAEAEAPVTALEQSYWRGLIAAGGRLVSLSIRGYGWELLLGDGFLGHGLCSKCVTVCRGYGLRTLDGAFVD